MAIFTGNMKKTIGIGGTLFWYGDFVVHKPTFTSLLGQALEPHQHIA
jgi:hypothetical protein